MYNEQKTEPWTICQKLLDRYPESPRQESKGKVFFSERQLRLL